MFNCSKTGAMDNRLGILLLATVALGRRQKTGIACLALQTSIWRAVLDTPVTNINTKRVAI
jgi:hypothetical protein